MRSAYPAVFLCALACASVPTGSRSASNNTQANAATVAAPSERSALRGYMLTGSFATEYFSGETLYDVLRRRAPTYLRPRGGPSAAMGGSTDPIAVYINGSFAGNLDALNLIPAHEVFSVQRLSGSDASIRYGPKNGSGALLVTLIRH